MNDSHYKRFDGEDLILRDELAIDRTLLSNERTLLAYLRSGMTLLIAGVTIIHFSQEGWFWAVGVACIPTGLLVGILGGTRYRNMNRTISFVRQQAKSNEPGNAESNPGPSPRIRSGQKETKV